MLGVEVWRLAQIHGIYPIGVAGVAEGEGYNSNTDAAQGAQDPKAESVKDGKNLVPIKPNGFCGLKVKHHERETERKARGYTYNIAVFTSLYTRRTTFLKTYYYWHF